MSIHEIHNPTDFQLIFKVCPQPLAIIAPNDPVFTFIDVNEAYEMRSGLQRNYLKGISVFDAFPDNASNPNTAGIKKLTESFRRAIATGKPSRMPNQRYDIRNVKGDFEERWWSPVNTPILYDDGSVRYILHTVIEITEVHLTERSLKLAQQNEELSSFEKSEAISAKEASEMAVERFQNVIDNSQTGIFLIEPVKNEKGTLVDFRYKIANDKVASYSGRDKENMKGELVSAKAPIYKSNGLFEKYAETYLTGKPQHLDFYYTSDDVNVWLNINAKKLEDGVVVTFTDFTTLKNLQQEHENTIEELKRSNTDLEQFAYIASHDMQEPLRKIQAFGDILTARYANELSKDGSDIIQRMQHASQRMKTLIDDLLTYSRVSTEKRSFKKIILNHLIKDILTDMETTVREKKATIILDDFQPVHGDELSLRQLFQNLISNALKFSKPDVPPRIEFKSSIVKGKDVAHVVLPEPKKNYQHIMMHDEGIGFEPEYKERIFQIFQRLHGRSEYEGTGVGLSIARKVIDMHKGAITADGTLSEGATFHIYLPLEK